MGKGTNSRALRASSFPRENLMEFSGGDDKFSGPLPESIVRLGLPGTLDLHSNEISGELPVGIQSWTKLNELNLASNQPSGKIPFGLQNMKLNVFNLSYNRLLGEFPPLFAEEIYRNSFWGILVSVEIWMGCVIAEPRLKARGTNGCLGASSFFLGLSICCGRGLGSLEVQEPQEGELNNRQIEMDSELSLLRNQTSLIYSRGLVWLLRKFQSLVSFCWG